MIIILINSFALSFERSVMKEWKINEWGEKKDGN